MHSNLHCLLMQLRYSLQLCLAKKCTTLPSRCLMNCSSTEPMPMEMIPLLTRLSGPETPPWTSSDRSPNHLCPVSSHTLYLRRGFKRGAHLIFPFKKSAFPLCDAVCSCSPSLRLGEPEGWTWGLNSLLITDLGTWRWAKEMLIIFPGVAKPRSSVKIWGKQVLLQRLAEQAGKQQNLLQTRQRHQQRAEDPSCVPCMRRWDLL